jgi:mRNA interferase RelE/StbE
MSHTVIVKPAAERDIDRLPPSVQQRIVAGLAKIQCDPRGPGTVKLSGTKATYRVRVGDYRIVYEIDDGSRTVFVTIVAHRREVYR